MIWRRHKPEQDAATFRTAQHVAGAAVQPCRSEAPNLSAPGAGYTGSGHIGNEDL